MVPAVGKLVSVLCLAAGVVDLLVIDLHVGPRALAHAAHASAAKVEPIAVASVANIAVTEPTVTPAPNAAVGAALAAATPAPSTPEPAASAAASVELREPQVVIHFETGAAEADAEAEIRELARRLTAAPNARVEIEGHADRRGTVENNRLLSTQRAKWIRKRLRQLGIDESRMSVVGYGASRPVRVGDDAESLAANRRVQARIVEK